MALEIKSINIIATTATGPRAALALALFIDLVVLVLGHVIGARQERERCLSLVAIRRRRRRRPLAFRRLHLH